jgi:hypothetical protein
VPEPSVVEALERGLLLRTDPETPEADDPEQGAEA